jgi:hypothetical protein
VFLAENTVARPFGADQSAHRSFRFAVGRGHRIERPFAFVDDVQAFPEVGPDDRTRGVGEPVGKSEGIVVKIVHLGD